MNIFWHTGILSDQPRNRTIIYRMYKHCLLSSILMKKKFVLKIFISIYIISYTFFFPFKFEYKSNAFH